MSSTGLSNFLRVALDVQATPYPGIHVADGVAAATDGVMLVAKKFDLVFLRGEGAISPKAAKVLAALAGATWIGSVAVVGNRVTVTAQSTWYDEKVGAEVAGAYREVTLPEFYCPRAPVARILAVLTDESRGWETVAENPNVKVLKEMSARDYVALIDNPRNGGELFRPKADNDTHWYSVAQLRRGLRLFGKNSRLNVRRSSSGWLAFGDQWGYTFTVTPFVKHN
jgi:hypothetical protein